jgi:hypothetical protein
MDTLDAAEKKRTLFIGITAQGNHEIKGLPGEFLKCLGVLTGDVNAQFSQNNCSKGIDPGGLGAG